MAEIDLKVNEKEFKQIEADSHNTTSQLVDLLGDDLEIGNASCKKESNENIAFEENLMCLVKNSKHSKIKEVADETVSGELSQPVADVEKSRLGFPSESPISEHLLQCERENEFVSNKAWQKSGIGSELQKPDLTLCHQDCKPPHEGNTWKIGSPEEKIKLDSEEKSEVLLKETVKIFNIKESSEDFTFKVNEEDNQVDIEPPDDKKHIRISSNSGNAVAASNKLRQYSRDQLLTLMSAPASRAWPEYFDITFKKPEGKMDLEKWVKAKQDGKFNGSSSISVKSVPSGNSNSINSSSDRALEQDTKRSKDPRERIKQELHGGLTVVLSPQRKSFSTGCHVTQQSSLNIGGTECNIDRSRELPVNRRIGSGRIARREDNEQLCQNDNRRRDHRDNDKDVDQRREHKSGWRTKNENIISVGGNNRFDRDDRPGGPHIDKRRRFFDDDDDKRNEQRRDFRDSRDRRYNNNNHRRASVSRDMEEEAPEWFTGGPSSQNEYIELVGFDDSEKEVVKQKFENRKLKKEKDIGGSSKNSRCATPVIIENVIDESESEKSGAQMADTSSNPIVVEPSNDQSAFQFNVEDYIGSILNLGPDEMFHCSSGGSRLKQFFNNRESPVEDRVGAECHSKRSSPPGRESLSQLGSLIGFAEPVIRVPSPNSGLNSSHFFTPISPADKTSGGRGAGESLVEMLQKANSSNTTTTKKLPQQPSVMPGSGRLPPPSVKDLIMGGKGQSLEEIEANLRRGRAGGGGQALNIGGLCNNTQFNQQHQHSFNTNKPPLSPHRPNQQLHSQQNPFSDLLVKNGDIASCAGPVGSKPQPLLNNATSENEFLAQLIRGGGVSSNTGANMNNSSLLSLNVPPPRLPPAPMNNLNLAPPSHNLTPGNVPSLPQHSPSRSHLMPQQQPQHSSGNNPDVFIKLMQNQQHKKHLLHPGFPQQQHSQQPPHLDPIKQLLGGMNNMSLNSHQNQDISRDVHNLFQRVAAGQLTDSQLIAQLSSGNLTLNQREAVTTVLKLLSRRQNSPSLMPPRANLTPSPTPQTRMSGGLPLGNAASSISPRVASPNPDASMLAPHMIQQTRVSPLMFGSGAPLRTFSHQELVVHAQSILQKALLKNELERAKEKHRKREAAERTRSPNPAPGISMQNGPSSVTSLSMNRPNQDGSPTKGSKCQSPLAFTPISVLRKMTAEKDRSEKDKHEGYGMSEMDKLRDSQNRLPNHQNTTPIHAGAMNLKNEKKSTLPSGNSMLGPRAQMVMSGAQTTSMMHLNPHVISNQRHLNLQQTTIPLPRNPQQNMRVMQQNPQIIRTTMQQHMNNMNTHPAMHSRMQNPQNHGQNLSFGNGGPFKSGDNSLNVPKPMGSQNSSPINFMNFFGRDVLAKVQAGGMPELPGGKALSLEEVERQQTQAVPN